MARPRVKAIDSTEVISVRISKKTKYLLDLACRTKNLTVGRYIEEAIIDSLENIETKDKRRNLKTARDDFWADEESERFIWLIDNAKFSLSPDEERIKNIIYRFHQNNKLVFINQKGNYKEDLINVPKEKITCYKLKVEQEFKNKFGITSQINIVANKTIKPYPGKIIRVRDLRKLKISN